MQRQRGCQDESHSHRLTIQLAISEFKNVSEGEHDDSVTFAILDPAPPSDYLQDKAQRFHEQGRRAESVMKTHLQRFRPIAKTIIASRKAKLDQTFDDEFGKVDKWPAGLISGPLAPSYRPTVSLRILQDHPAA